MTPSASSDPELSGTVLVGTVLAVQANYYFVQLQSAGAVPIDLLCTRRDRLRKIGQKVMVGDRVVLEEPDWQGKRAAISQVLDRSSVLDRPPIANANQILLVFALADPQLDPNQLSRFLIKAESTGLEVCLCLSKADLVAPEVQQAWRDRFEQWGYQPLFISTYHQMGLDQVRQRLRDRMTIVSGPSGVGKSSLINQMIPAVDIRVAGVSGKLGRGRHTTRHVELFDLPTGGLLADSPGFNQPDLDYLPEELARYFPEIRQRLAQGHCQFGDCRHREEPGCVVRGDWERYELYRLFLAEVLTTDRSRQQQTDPDTIMKKKVGGKGNVSYEPRLASKYRQESRRSEKQSTHLMKGRVEDLLEDNQPD
jgi:ribosome biogenesis GTPase / thiamine phosphate phosphatase